jgi:spoIIIJ-associated protein
MTGKLAQTTPSDRSIEEAIQYAKKLLEDILSFFGLNTDVYATTEDKEVIELNVPSTHLNGFLIGQRGETMRALQFIVSSALQNQGFSHVRVSVDVADYKKSRAERLSKAAEEWLRQVKESGQPLHLKPMNAADRRTIHKLAGEENLVTQSEGEGPDRHVVIKPAVSVYENLASQDSQAEKTKHENDLV